MMDKSCGLLAAVVVSIFSTNAFAESFTCPPSIAVSEAPAAVDGFTASSETKHYPFRFVSFFDGDPKEMADLAPDEELKADIIVQVWDLEPTEGRAITAVCRYRGTEATLQATLPDTIKSCTLVTPKTGNAAVTLSCK
jgi:hypothetical protein